MNFALFDVSILKLETQIVHDSIRIIGVFNVHGQCIVVVNRIDQFEQVKHIDSNDDLVLFALVRFKILRFQEQMNQYRMRLVHVDDTHTVRLKCNVGLE